MKYISISIIALLIAVSFDAAALPTIPAKQVSVDASSMTTITGQTVQAAVDQIDDRIGDASTGTVGVVKFATQAEVISGISTERAVTPADLTSKARSFSMRYSGAVVHTGAVPSTWTNLDLSLAVGTNRVFAVLYVIAGSSPLNLVARGADTTGDVAGAYNTGSGLLSGFAMDNGQACVGVITDTNGVINIKSITYPGTSNSQLKVGCYQILSD